MYAKLPSVYATLTSHCERLSGSIVTGNQFFQTRHVGPVSVPAALLQSTRDRGRDFVICSGQVVINSTELTPARRQDERSRLMRGDRWYRFQRFRDDDRSSRLPTKYFNNVFQAVNHKLQPLNCRLQVCDTALQHALRL